MSGADLWTRASEASLGHLGRAQTSVWALTATDIFKLEEEQNGEGKEEGLRAEWGTCQAGSNRVSRSSSQSGFPAPEGVV